MYLINDKLNPVYGCTHHAPRGGTTGSRTIFAARSPILSREELQRLVMDMVG